MSYRRFKFSKQASGSATVATSATVRSDEPPSVATVASVAGPLVDPDVAIAFEERAAIAEYDRGLPRSNAELLAALETAPLGPEHDRAAIIEAVAVHLDRLAVVGLVKR